jgi:predicted metalloprotease with PDZ domain
VYTRSLWVAEGITSYYDRLLVRRAGLCTVDEYLKADASSATSLDDLGKSEIERLQETPGRLVQPLENASLDAWIKFYRRDENTPNTAISYYTKGAVVAWLLDARIRRATGGSKSLDDVMRLAYGRFGGTRGFTPDDFRTVAREVAGLDLSDFFRHALESTEELDYRPALEWFGLRFAQPKPEDSQPSAPGETEKAWLGLETRIEGGRLVVTQIKRSTPAHAAGFNVGDEILAIGEFRVAPDQWPKRLELFRRGEKASFLIARRERVMRLDAAFGTEPLNIWRLEIDPSATAEQIQRRKSWLGEP